MRDHQQRTATLDRTRPNYAAVPGRRQLRHPSMPAPHLDEPMPAQEDKSHRRAQGVRDLVGGGILIGIGLVMGGSVFTGDPTILDWIFDGLGTFWCVKGLYLLVS